MLWTTLNVFRYSLGFICDARVVWLFWAIFPVFRTFRAWTKIFAWKTPGLPSEFALYVHSPLTCFFTISNPYMLIQYNIRARDFGFLGKNSERPRGETFFDKTSYGLIQVLKIKSGLPLSVFMYQTCTKHVSRSQTNRNHFALAKIFSAVPNTKTSWP